MRVELDLEALFNVSWKLLMLLFLMAVGTIMAKVAARLDEMHELLEQEQYRNARRNNV